MKNMKADLKDFRADFTKAMVALEQKYGVGISIGAITYDSTSFRCKMNAISSSAPKVTPQNLAQVCQVGTMFKRPGKQSIYTIIDFRSNEPVNKIVVQTNRGAKYLMSLATFATAQIL